VVVDERLEGKMMCLRVSMRKFNRKEGEEHEDAPIEIARAFGHPNMCNLNKSVTTFTFKVRSKRLQ
jgi:RNA dependent RNA polymerase